MPSAYINSRSVYEHECAKIGVVPLSDEAILAQSYAMEYGNFDDFYMTEHPYSFYEKVLAQEYYRHVLRPDLKEREASADTRTQESRQVQCPGCGQMMSPHSLMAASLGLVCPDCYDRYAG